MEPWYSDVKCGEIRAITSGISKFVRKRNPDLSGKSGCEMRRNPGNRYRDIEICPDAKSGSVRKMRMWTGCDCVDLSKKSGCEMWRNSGNHHRDLRENPDAKWGKIRICLLACLLVFVVAKQGFGAFSNMWRRIFADVWCREIRAIVTVISKFIRMRIWNLSGWNLRKIKK